MDAPFFLARHGWLSCDLFLSITEELITLHAAIDDRH